MKTTSILMFLIVAMMLTFTPSYATAPDTVVVAAYPPGNLNGFIQGDTLADGTRPNRVYVLQQTGAVDSVYLISGTLQVHSLTLIGKNNPITGFPPVILPNINDDGGSPSPLIRALGNGTIFLSNLYIMGTRIDGSCVTGSCIYTGGDNSWIMADRCVFENFGTGGNPNIWDTWGAVHIKMKVTNCIFRDNQCDVPQNPGMNWAGPGPYAVDTAIYKNNTFFIIGGTIVGSDQTPLYVEFDHNTVFMMTKAALFTLQQLYNVKITNNICYGVFAIGLDSSTAYNIANQNANFYSLPAVVELDTLGSMKGDPWFFTEAGRTISVQNNAYFWPVSMHNRWSEINAAAAATPALGRIVEPTFVETRVPGMLTDKVTWPGILFASNLNVDPGFDADMVQHAADTMLNFGKVVWSTGSGAGVRPYLYKSDPLNMFAGVPANWKTTKSYPVIENLRYSNTSLQHAATDGKAIGDLNWFPEQGPTAVSQTPNSMPGKFKLGQNYPNPFNPSTKISYTLAAKSMTRLSVYDILGREVAVLVNEVQNAGSYDVTFTANNLSSGIYFYKLVSSETTSTMKMILMK